MPDLDQTTAGGGGQGTASPSAAPPRRRAASSSPASSGSGYATNGASQLALKYGATLSTGEAVKDDPSRVAYGISEDLANLNIVWGYEQAPGFPSGFTFGGPLLGPINEKTDTFLNSLKSFYSFDTKGFLPTLQARLINTGFLTKKGWKSFGDPDDTSFAAWKKALTRAARSGKSIWQVLGVKDEKEFGATAQSAFEKAVKSVGGPGGGGRGGGGGGAARAPFQATVENPADLMELADRVAGSVLGTKAPPGFGQKFAKAYQAQQVKVQRQAYDGAGRLVKPPDASVAAEDMLRGQFGTETTGHDVAVQFENLLRIIGGSDGSA